jgi:hypothetical protein
MAGSKHSDVLTFREIEYTIQIQDKDSGFHEVNDLLCAELTRFEDTRNKRGRYENPIRDFLKTNIERSIVIRDSTKVYFVDYQEKGSFTITFRLVLISRYINYGTVRQAIDYLIKDTIGNYFEELLERHIPVSITIRAADNELYEIPAGPPDINSFITRPPRDYLPIILSALALVVTLILGLIFIVTIRPSMKVTKPSDEYRDKNLELLIEKQLEQAYDKERYNTLIRRTIEPDSDSVQRVIQKVMK